MIVIGGLVPFTTIDFPGELATVIFCQGCPLECKYCHNKHLKPFNEPKEDIPWDDFLGFLEHRRKLINAVVLSGGEPLFQPKLKEAIEELKLRGYKVALHTSGANFESFAKVYDLLDFVAMDFKLPFSEYASLYKKTEEIKASLELVASGNVMHEVRTTLDPSLLDKDKVLEMASYLKSLGVKNYAIQLCRATEDYFVDEKAALSFFVDNDFIDKLKQIFPNIVLRK